MTSISAPISEAELLDRAEAIAGEPLKVLADRLGIVVPPDLKRAKGWVGQLIEKHLGADAGSRAVPDFSKLGVELKTLPIDERGRPLESTFVCSIELPEIADSEWASSRLWHKLQRVLWVPVEGRRELPVGQRRVASPFLWTAEPNEEAQLRADWEHLALLIAQGRTGEITGHLGEVLQVRPKAARGSSRRLGVDADGALYDEQPRGFYLRARFTGSILARQFGL